MSENHSESLDLTARHALVTGGASGIGRATAHRLAAAGADVLVTDVDETGGEAVAAEIGATFAVLDVADSAAWTALVRAHGPFDIAFLNAGVSTGEVREPTDMPIAGLDDDRYRRIMAINVDGVVFGTRAVLPHMLDTGRGDIICTASMAGLGPIGADPIYGLTKHAVVGFVRSVARAAEERGIDLSISAICPGFVDTNILDGESKDMIRQVGLGILDPLEVGDVVLRSLDERPNGGQWVIWHGLEPQLYEWNPPIDPSVIPGAVFR